METTTIITLIIAGIFVFWLDYRANKKLKDIYKPTNKTITNMNDQLLNLARQAEQLRIIQKAVQNQTKVYFTTGDPADWTLLGEFADTERKVATTFDDTIGRIMNSY